MALGSNMIINVGDEEVHPKEILLTSQSIPREYRVEVKSSENEGKSDVKIWMEGKLGIENINDIQDQLKPLFDDHQRIAVVLREVVEIDLTSIQLLYYLEIKANRAGKMVVVSSDLKEDVAKVILQSGFGEFLLNQK